MFLNFFKEIQKHNFFISCTNATTGKSEQKKPSNEGELYNLIQSSCATPLYYKNHLLINGQQYIDGALSDPLPITSFLQKENEKTVIIRNKNNFGKASKIPALIESIFYINKPALRRSVKLKHQNYEKSMELALERDNFLIVEPKVIKSSFAKSNISKIEQDYSHGRECGIDFIDKIKSF